ncbi:MAG: hypothetical protein HYU67_12295 [Flavobacteriia bacterium]|nr:hypothetical protein [Flavobacteriia bacterium]
MFKNKSIKTIVKIIILLFSFIGFGLTMAYIAIQFQWTKQDGSIDSNSRYLEYVHSKNQTINSLDEKEKKLFAVNLLKRILLLNKFYPKHAENIMIVYKQNNYSECAKMLEIVEHSMEANSSYNKALQLINKITKPIKNKKNLVFDWMNRIEWEDFKIAVKKDKKLIDSVEKVTNVESRLIVSCLVGEQIRLFNSNREAYKKWIGPLKILSVESQFSLGVTGIKDFTAERIEKGIKDPSSLFYLGKQYEHLLDFKTENIQEERFKRLTSFRNHYYSYLYAALFLKQMKVQWEKSGYSIDNRPEILATLFNVGYAQSKPNPSPKVGGSSIEINGKKYTFGNIAHQFYYSGELIELFPINIKKFDFEI